MSFFTALPDPATTVSNTDFPKRGVDYRRDYVIPLYVGDTRIAFAPQGK